MSTIRDFDNQAKFNAAMKPEWVDPNPWRPLHEFQPSMIGIFQVMTDRNISKDAQWIDHDTLDPGWHDKTGLFVQGVIKWRLKL